jgi:hypothetical protein
MATEERVVKIVAWPTQPAALTHSFDSDEPCPVAIRFEEKPAHVRIETSPERPLHVAMDTRLSTGDKPLGVCISVCEPICADSDYRIGLSIFDNPVAEVSVRGRTRIGACKGDAPARVCVDFKRAKVGQVFDVPFSHQGLNITPLGAPLRIVDLGTPEGQPKLSIPPTGMRIDFALVVSKLELRLNNYAGNELRVRLLGAAGALLLDQMVAIANQERAFTFTMPGVHSVELSGGNNEASLIQVCYSAEQKEHV